MGKKNIKKKQQQEKEAKKAEEEEADFDRMLKEVKQDDPDQGPQAVEPPPAAVRTRGLVSVSALCHMNTTLVRTCVTELIFILPLCHRPVTPLSHSHSTTILPTVSV